MCALLIHADEFQKQEEYAQRYIIPQVHQIVQDAHHADKRRKTAFTPTPVHQAQGEHRIKPVSVPVPVQHLRPRQYKLMRLSVCDQSFCKC